MNNYEILQPIGQGQYGTAYKCRNRTDNQMYCIKKIPMSAKDDQRGALKEATLLASLDHPNVLGYQESFIDKDNALCIITHYCEEGDLFNKIRQRAHEKTYFSEAEIMDLFTQIASALMYIHGRKILHRDLKTQNIFIARGGIAKLGDFGISKVLEKTDQFATTVTGTPYYMAPEICTNQPYTFKSDIWSLGCVLYELCTLKHAFAADSLLSLVYQIVRGTFPPIPSDVFSKGMSDLVNTLLVREAAQRPSLHQIFQLPFVQQHIQRYHQEERRRVLQTTSIMTLKASSSIRRHNLQAQLEASGTGRNDDMSDLTPKERALRKKEAERNRRALELELASVNMQKERGIAAQRKNAQIHSSNIGLSSGNGSQRPAGNNGNGYGDLYGNMGADVSASRDRRSSGSATGVSGRGNPWDVDSSPPAASPQRASTHNSPPQYGGGDQYDNSLVNFDTMPGNFGTMPGGGGGGGGGGGLQDRGGTAGGVRVSQAMRQSGGSPANAHGRTATPTRGTSARNSALGYGGGGGYSTHQASDAYRDDDMMMGSVMQTGALGGTNTYGGTVGGGNAAYGGTLPSSQVQSRGQRTAAAPSYQHQPMSAMDQTGGSTVNYGTMNLGGTDAGGGMYGQGLRQSIIAQVGLQQSSSSPSRPKSSTTNSGTRSSPVGSSGSDQMRPSTVAGGPNDALRSLRLPAFPGNATGSPRSSTASPLSAGRISVGISGESNLRSSTATPPRYTRQPPVSPPPRPPPAHNDDHDDYDDDDFEDYDPASDQEEVKQREKILQNVKAMESTFGRSSGDDATAGNGVSERVAPVTKSSKAKQLEQQCQAALGPYFTDVYNYLRVARDANKPIQDEREVQRRLLELVRGDRVRLQGCFGVDQLVFAETMTQ